MSEDRAGIVRKQPDFGIDAPGVVRNNLIIGIILAALGAVLFNQPATALAGWGPTVAVVLLLAGLSLVLTDGIMVWGSRSGKLRLRDRLLGEIPWRGDERVLDAGCGRGLMLIGAAERAPRGHVFGIDLWRDVDQSGNFAVQTLANARAAGVAERVTLTTGDMRALPYPDGCFDGITSSWAIHNIPEREGRARAIREFVRVLRPGGWIAIADIERVDEYLDELRAAGAAPIVRSRPYYIFAIPSYTLRARMKDEG